MQVGPRAAFPYPLVEGRDCRMVGIEFLEFLGRRLDLGRLATIGEFGGRHA